MYAAAKQSRLTAGWGQSNTSADSELVSSLRTLRARSRALVRDAAYATRAKVIVQNNVIGAGIGMQAQVKTASGKLNTRVNDEIEAAWEEWSRAEHCHTGGGMCFADLERAFMGEVFEAGESVSRKFFQPFGGSAVPYALEMVESERIADEFQPSALMPDARVRMGVESDAFHRAVAYWIRMLHPGELRLTAEQTDRLERVDASLIHHLRIIDRWPQTRGVPWLHAVARKLNDMDGYSEAEIIAARAAACYMGIIQSSDPAQYQGEEQADGSVEFELEAGVVRKLEPGETFNDFSPNRPNAQIDPFMRMMLREVAAGAGVSYESLSRDYSQSNYSSSRLALLDDRDLWRMLQLWFIRNFRSKVHREWLQQAVLARAIPSINVAQYAAAPARFEAVRFKPRGWGWIDPAKEVQAFKEAVKAGFTTTTHVIAQSGDGRDIEDVLVEREHELEMAKEKGLTFDTDPGAEAKAQPPVAQEPDQDEADALARWAAEQMRS